MDQKSVCISCKKEISSPGSVKFKCPNCLKHDIIRCKHCRELASRYVCPACGFSGPN